MIFYLRFLNCTLESASCVIRPVIYETMYWNASPTGLVDIISVNTHVSLIDRAGSD